MDDRNGYVIPHFGRFCVYLFLLDLFILSFSINIFCFNKLLVQQLQLTMSSLLSVHRQQSLIERKQTVRFKISSPQDAKASNGDNYHLKAMITLEPYIKKILEDV